MKHFRTNSSDINTYDISAMTCHCYQSKVNYDNFNSLVFIPLLFVLVIIPVYNDKFINMQETPK